MPRFTSIGIDPGSKPTICVLRNWARRPEDVTFYENEQVSTRRGIGDQSKAWLPNAEAINRILAFHRPGVIVIEEVWPREGWAIQNSLRFVGSAELCRGLAIGQGLPVRRLRPQQWQKRVNKMKGKDGSRATAMSLRPHLSSWFQRKLDHNRADAFLIAWCGHGMLQRAYHYGVSVKDRPVSKQNKNPPQL